MKQELYRPVQQRSILSEITQDKAGDLPPTVYSKATKVNFPEDVERDYQEEERDLPALPWRKVLSR